MLSPSKESFHASFQGPKIDGQDSQGGNGLLQGMPDTQSTSVPDSSDRRQQYQSLSVPKKVTIDGEFDDKQESSTGTSDQHKLKQSYSKSSTFRSKDSRGKRSSTSDTFSSEAASLSGVRINAQHLMYYIHSTTIANQREGKRRMFLRLVHAAFLSNFSCRLLIVVDFALLLHCLDVKASEESIPDSIFAVQGCLLGWFSLQAGSRLLLAMMSTFQNDECDENSEEELEFRAAQEKKCCNIKLWEILDVILLLISLFGVLTAGFWSSVAILPRILRSIHLLRVEEFGFRPLESLREIVQLIAKAKGSVFFSLVLLILQTFVFAAFGMELVQVKLEDPHAHQISEKFGIDVAELCCDAFSTLVLSVSTLFSLAWGNQWDTVALPIISVKPWTIAFFMSHVLISSVLLCGSFYAAMNHTLVQWRAHQNHLFHDHLMKEKRVALDRLDDLFTALDTNGDGLLTWDEFFHNRQCDPECHRICNKLDIDDDSLHKLWSVLDVNQDGCVDRKEFLDLMWKLQSPESKWTLIQQGHLMKQMHARIEQQYKMTQKGFSLLQVQQQDQQQLLKSMRALLGGQPEPETERSATATIDKEEETQNTLRRETRTISKFSETSDALELATDFLRGVKADKVAHYNRTEVIDFWMSGAFVDGGINREFHMSQSCDFCDFFVSHCWNVPEDYYNYFQRNDHLEAYEYKKAMVVHQILADGKAVNVLENMDTDASSSMISLTPSSNRKKEPQSPSRKMKADDRVAKAMLWVDKACIPQSDKEKKDLCVKLIEQFMQLSRGFIVILSWNYFTRLWCVYEWACYLRLHSLKDLRIFLGCDVFLKSSPADTLPLYLASIENLSVTALQCHNQSDHEILEDKVFHYYRGKTRLESFASFERFAKCTAISFLGKQIVRFRARGSTEDQNAWLGPIIASAKKMGYNELHNAMAMAEPARWFGIANKKQESFDLIVEFWFQRIVVQYLDVERKKAVRPGFIKSDDKADIFEMDPSMSKGLVHLFSSGSFNLGSLANDDRLMSLFPTIDSSSRAISSEERKKMWTDSHGQKSEETCDQRDVSSEATVELWV